MANNNDFFTKQMSDEMFYEHSRRSNEDTRARVGMPNFGFAHDYHNTQFSHRSYGQISHLLDLSKQSLDKIGKPLIICEYCGKSNPINRCSQCHKSYYCNEKCQRAHWRKHKRLCIKKT